MEAWMEGWREGWRYGGKGRVKGGGGRGASGEGGKEEGEGRDACFSLVVISRSLLWIDSRSLLLTNEN